MLKEYLGGYVSEEDEDYNPTAREEATYRQSQREVRKRAAKKGAENLWEELQEEQEEERNRRKKEREEEEIRRKTRTNQELKSLAEQIMEDKCIKTEKKIIFAGKEFLLNEATGQLEEILKEATIPLNPIKGQSELENLQISYQYLNHVMRAIYHRGRKINSVAKSKLDWKGFVKQEGIQAKLHYNRKGGVIQDMNFINKAP